MTSSPSDPWGAPAPPPDDPWSVPSPYPPAAPPAGPASAPPAAPASAPPGGSPGSVPAPAHPVSGQPASSPPAHPPTVPLPANAPTAPVSAYVPPPDPQPGPVIMQIAEIAVTSTTVHTPTGDIPLAGSQWQVNDYWFSQQRIPRWAVIAAIVGFCVLTVFSLLFLLVKENVMQGTVQVTVTNGSRQYVARIPVADQNGVTAINQQVNYVRTLAAL
ncbi:hypothetical protein ACQP2F_07000 [Actinoplanes sp. CA-030573]|uniref:hypothetical protein n=1 Tax=Actinoplanes sp. CA-030573 TaxID=3239898 RepID=UPI003D8BB5D8